MFDLEREIGQWLKKLRKSPGFEDGDIEEIEEHIRNSVESELDIGSSEEQAFNKAKELFGSMDLASDEMLKSRTDKTELPKPKKYLELSHPNSNNQLINSSIMFNNYIKIALRNFSRSKLFSLINVMGLAIGMAACTLIFLWVQDEMSYEKSHKNGDRIYRLIMAYPNTAFQEKYFPGTAGPVIPDLKSKYPEIEMGTRFYALPMQGVQYENEVFDENDLAFVDADFFSMFTYTFLSGDPITVLTDPNAVVITKSTSEKIFGNNSPLGKTILAGGDKRHVVKGVIDDITDNTHLNADVFIPFKRLNDYLGQNYGDVLTRPDLFFFSSYIMLTKEVLIDQFAQKADSFLGETYEPKDYEIEKDQFEGILNFQSIKRIHLFSGDVAGGNMAGDIKSVRMFSIVAIFILLIACINFTNLTTAHSVRRIKEVGLRKVFGGLRKDLIKQFYIESLLLAFFAVLIAVLIVLILTTPFNSFVNKELSLFAYGNLGAFFYLICIALITGIISGSYPALLLSAYTPTQALKGNNTSNKGGGWFRQITVTLQFTVAIILVLSSYILFKQYQYIQNRDLGFDKDQLIYLETKGDIIEKFDILRNELLKNSSITNATRTSSLMTFGSLWAWDFEWEGMQEGDVPPGDVFKYVSIDEHFMETCGLEIVEGSDFISDLHDSVGQILINEETAKLMNVESPVGISARYGRIAGVVKNYHFESLKRDIAPLILFRSNRWYRYIYVKVKPQNLSETLGYIDEVFTSIDPSQTFEYKFMDEAFARLYDAERRMGQLIKHFTYLAIFVACLGLFGMVMYTVQRRKKEIGIRKVLGCSVFKIALMINKEIARCIVIASIISWPIVWYFMSQWLEQFAFRTEMEIISFILSGVAIFLISIITVSYNSIKAGRMNPVESLRYE